MIPHYIRLAVTAIAMLVIAIPSTGFACSMTSNPEVTIALGNPAPHTVDPDEILEGTPACGPYVVTVFNTNGSMRLDPIVDCGDVGKRLLVKVTGATGNSVWSYVSIEDNLKPEVAAANITVSCVEDIESLGFDAITATDNCTATEDLEYRITSLPSSVGCSNGIAQTYVRSIFAIDEYGNRSATVPQTITVTRVDIADVVFPGNLTYFTSDTTICPAEFGTPEIEFPTVNGNPISAVCKLLTKIEDEELSSCGTSRKILREYRVLDCCTNEIRTAFQVINIMDDQAPKLLTGLGQILPDTLSASNIQGNLNCTGTMFFPSIVAEDSCGSTPLTYRISTPFGVVNANGGQLNASFPLDETYFNAIYEVGDACGNLAFDTIVIFKEDNLAPVAICDEITTISLATAATTLPAINFDDGSYDNCGIDSFTVRRMGDTDWLESLTITCDDVTDTVLVEFRVTDFNGNSNICMVQVIVEDKIPASVNPLPSLTFSCIRNPVDTFFSGVPTVNEVCVGGYSLDTIINDDSMLQCRTGTQERKFIFTNAAGEMIMTTQPINYVDSGMVNIPTALADTTIDCSVNVLALPTRQFATDCDVFAVNASTSTTRVIDCSTTEFNVVYNYMPLCGFGPGFTLNRTITQVDNDGPIWDSFPGDIDSTYACVLPSTVLAPTATDNCNGVNINFEGVVSVPGGVPNCPDVTNTYTWTVSDACGNVNPTPFVRVIRMRDEVAPTFATIDSYAVACKAEIRDTLAPFNIVQAGVTDNCTQAVNIEILSNVVDTMDACEGSIIRTYLATDVCGNTSTASQTISYDQTGQSLVLNTLPAVINLQCYSDVTAYPEPTLEALGGSACGAGLTITNTTTEPAPNSCSATVLKTYDVVDDCGNTGSVSQSFTYDDTIDPEISGPADLTVQCEGDIPAINLGEASATDNCSVPGISASEIASTGNTTCAGSIVRTFTATDDCSNNATTTQVISWDGVGPLTLRQLVNDGVAYSCYAEVVAAQQIIDASFFGNGICGTALRIDSVNHTSDPGCGGNVMRGYYLQDECGNRDSVFQNFILNDFEAPTIVGVVDITVLCAGDIPDTTATKMAVMVDDNCAGRSVSLNILSDVVISMATCSGSVERTYIATDDCGNTSTVSQTISYDQTNQALILNQLDDVTGLQCYSEVTSYAIPSLQDIGGSACGEDLTITATTTGPAPAGCPATVIRTFTVADDCGNTGSVTQSFTYNDTTDPEISGPGSIDVQCRSDVPTGGPTALGVTATDNCGNVAISFTEVADSRNTDCAGQIVRTYIATDDCANTASLTQSITWIQEGVLTLKPLQNDGITYNCYDDILAVEEELPTFFGEGICGTVLSINEVTHSADPGCSGTVTRTYMISDECANSGTVEQEFTLNYLATPIFVGLADTTILCADDLPSEQTTSRNISVQTLCTNRTANYSVVSTIADINNTVCEGFFTRTYQAIDDCNNSSTAEQIISYGRSGFTPTNLPTHPDTFLCYQDVLDYMPVYNPADFGVGMCGTDLSIQGFANSSNPGCSGSITRTFILVDECLNTATATQILVLKDTIGPELMPPTDRSFFNSCERAFDNVRATLINQSNNTCNDDLATFTFTNNSQYLSGTGDANSLDASGIYPSGITEIIYTATDLCGNVDSVSSIINVIDPVRPTIDCENVFLILDEFGEATLDETELGTYVSAEDNCEVASLRLIEPQLPISFDCLDNLPLVLDYTYEAEDRSGNTRQASCQIIVQDPPKLECKDLEFSMRPGLDLEITIADVISQMTYSDNCTDISDLSFSSSTLPFTYSCSNLGTSSPTTFTHSLTVQDLDFEETTCVFEIAVFHDCSSPPQDPFALAGQVNAPLYGGTMDSTLVSIDYNGGSMETLSDSDGNYSFVNIPSGAISLTAKLPMKPTERVTTYDMLRIGQHLLGIQPLEDPLVLLAADVNKSGNISAFDLTAIRRVILGQDQAFSGEHEAATVGAYHPFRSNVAPWADANNWGTQFDYVSEDMMSLDISAIKLGDINPDAFLLPRGASELILDDRFVTEGQTVELLVRNDLQTTVAGLQLALEAEGRLTIAAADENVEVFSHTIEGATRISILQEMLQGEPIMTWSFTPQSSGMLSDLIKISDAIPNESYSIEDLHPGQLALHWNAAAIVGAVAELNAFPNPFDKHLSISAHLIKEGKHTLQVTDMTGRSFAEREIEVSQDSWHNFRLDTENWASGVYILNIEGPTGRLTKRVVLQR